MMKAVIVAASRPTCTPGKRKRSYKTYKTHEYKEDVQFVIAPVLVILVVILFGGFTASRS